jgi:hypothetical protein
LAWPSSLRLISELPRHSALSEVPATRDPATRTHPPRWPTHTMTARYSHLPRGVARLIVGEALINYLLLFTERAARFGEFGILFTFGEKLRKLSFSIYFSLRPYYILLPQILDLTKSKGLTTHQIASERHKTIRTQNIATMMAFFTPGGKQKQPTAHSASSTRPVVQRPAAHPTITIGTKQPKAVLLHGTMSTIKKLLHPPPSC